MSAPYMRCYYCIHEGSPELLGRLKAGFRAKSVVRTYEVVSSGSHHLVPGMEKITDVLGKEVS